MLTMRKVYGMLLSLVVLNGLDIATTYIGLSMGLAEANQLRPDLNPAGKMTAVIAFCLLWLTTWHISKKEKNRLALNASLILLMALIGFYASVVAWNVALIMLRLMG